MKSGIYKITVGSWFYWGSTKNFHRRKQEHIRELKQGKHKNSILQNAYNKHNSFEFEVIANVEEQELLEWEQELIDVWFGSENCANISKKVDAPPSWEGRRLTEEHKTKLSFAAKGRQVIPKGTKRPPRDPEWSAKIAAAKRGKKQTPETIEKRVAAWKATRQRSLTNAETIVE